MSLPLRQPTFTPDTVYLDTATYGLAAESVVEAMSEGIDRWRRGTATMPYYDGAVDRSRAVFAQLMGVDPAVVAVANQASVFVGVVAASLPAGSVVLAPEGEFTSVLFPFLVAEDRGLEVRTVPLSHLADAIDDEVTMVAFSAVQSSDGSLADLNAIAEAAHIHGARTLVDATQAAGWLTIEADRFDYLVVSAYKWLLCPRGTAFMVLGPGHDPEMAAVLAGWYAGEDVWASIYGGPLRLAETARRFDVSPGWLAWVGSAPALEILAEHGVAAIGAHNLSLAADAQERLGLEVTGSAIFTVPLFDTSVLTKRGISAALRASSVRVGFHLYNDLSDVTALVKAVEGTPSG